tara:strand:- start:477 stop:668 length:192 start_codon:yes stop_codon:yes gene_type:complete
MTNIKRFILKIKLFLSTFYMKPKKHENKGFIYEGLDIDEIRKLPKEEQGKVVQKNWKKFMEEN